MQKIDLKQLFNEGHCSFDISQRMAKVGIEPNHTALSYDKSGSLGNGGWVAEIWEEKDAFFPAVNLYEAVVLLESVADAEPEFGYDGEKYIVRMGNKETVGLTRVDALCNMYLKYKEK